MPTLTELALVVGVIAAGLIYRSTKRAKHPQRLHEVESALKVRADLYQHRNGESGGTNELALLGDQLRRAQYLLNEGDAAVHRDWRRIRPAVLRLTSPEMLTRLDLYYSDRRDDIKAALYDLVTQLDKKAEAGAKEPHAGKQSPLISQRDTELIETFSARIGIEAKAIGFAQTVMSYPEIVTIGFGFHIDGGKMLLGTLAVSIGEGGSRNCSMRVASGDTPASLSELFPGVAGALEATESHFRQLARTRQGVEIP